MSREMKYSGIPWIGEIPKGWERIFLKHYFHFEKGKNAAIYTQEYIGSNLGDFPVYSGQTENQGIMGRINTFDYDESECLFTTTVGAKVMTPKILQGKFSLSQNCLIMKKIKDASVHCFFYGLSALFDYEKSLIPSHMQPSLRIEDLKKYILYIPSITEQQKIASFLDKKCSEIDEMIALQEKIVEELKAYKQSVITEAVTKGLNPDVPMKDSGIEWIGEIPEHWEIKRLKQESVFINGFAFNSEDFTIDNGVKVIRIGDIGLTVDFENCVRAITNPNALLPFKIKDGDILIAMSGATTGKCCIVSQAEDAYINQRVGIIRSDIRKIVYYSLLTPYFMEFVNLNNAGSAQPNISSKAIGEFPILLMPKEEQINIADYLDTKCTEIDNLISIKLSKIDSLKEYKKSIIYEYVTGKKEVTE